jgi:2-phospho-L-lactate/phosphoenolpyruvate guanylyltransferase
VTLAGWDVIVPLKDVAHAKTRLTVLGDRWRRTFARAMFLDTVEAAATCPLRVRVHAVTDDRSTIAELATFSRVVVHAQAPPGVNNAISHAAQRAGDRGWGQVALLGDLPALSGEEFAAVIDRAGAATRSVVPDAEEVGTTMLVVAAGRPLLPTFGAGSLARHLASGARPVVASAAARRDVDKPEDLWAAQRLGVGPRTAWALHALCGTGSLMPSLPSAG